MQAPVGAVALLKVHGRSDGMYEITYAMADSTRYTVLEYEERNMAPGPTLIQQMWDEVDLQYNFFQEKKKIVGQNEKDLAFTKGYLRGCVKMLSIFMRPHFNTPDDIVREVHRRWDHAQRGEEYETPGLGSLRYTPPPGTKQYTTGDVPGTTKQATKKSASSKKRVVNLSDEQKDGIKNALAAGMFSPEDLASMFKVPVETVKALQDS